MKDRMLQIRCSQDELNGWTAEAASLGVTVSELIRQRLRGYGTLPVLSGLPLKGTMGVGGPTGPVITKTETVATKRQYKEQPHPDKPKCSCAKCNEWRRNR